MDELVEIIRRELPEHMERWNLHVDSLVVQAEGGGWPIVTSVDDRTFDETYGITLWNEPIEDLNLLANSLLDNICALIQERLDAEPPPEGWPRPRKSPPPPTTS